MRPQAWAVLALLASNAGKVVTKAQMLDTVWRGLIVSDGSLAQAISDVRAALGDEGRAMIRTVARRGYLLADLDRACAMPANAHLGTGPNPPPRNSPRLFGRESELALLSQALLEHRLVTVLGAGGIGKTVFARTAAQGWMDTQSCGVAWVDLAPIADATQLPAKLAGALGLPMSPGEYPLNGLLAALRSLNLLLVFDNAEHMMEAVAPIVASILGSAPGISVLVTSQAPLRLESERLFRLKPLDVPGADEPLSRARLSPAVALFEDCAISGDRDFALTHENFGSVVRICRRLDGLPLAIRLAAGRARVLGLSALETHLHDRLSWLGSEYRNLPERQRTLLAALQWSYGLLGGAERRLYRQLGVFVSGFTLEIVIAMVREPDVDHGCIVAQLDGLVERCLVDREPGDPPRFRMLESQRALALQELGRLDELSDARHRHARVLVAAMEEAPEAIWWTPDSDWMRKWLPELDNLRAALRWSATNAPALFASLLWPLSPMYVLLSISHELRSQADAIDARIVADLDPGIAARFHLGRAFLEQRSATRRWEHVTLAEHCARMKGDQLILYLALGVKIQCADVDPGTAAALIEEMASLESADWPPRVRCMRWRAVYAAESMSRRWPQALHAAEAALELAIESGSAIARSICSNAVLGALIRANEIDVAFKRSAALRPFVVPGPANTVIPYLGTCARLHVLRNDLSGARDLLEQMFELCRAVEWSYFDVFCTVYCRLAQKECRLESAARLVGYTMRASTTFWGMPGFEHWCDDVRAELAASMDPTQLEALYAEGARLGPEEVCRLTLERE